MANKDADGKAYLGLVQLIIGGFWRSERIGSDEKSGLVLPELERSRERDVGGEPRPSVLPVSVLSPGSLAVREHSSADAKS